MNEHEELLLAVRAVLSSLPDDQSLQDTERSWVEYMEERDIDALRQSIPALRFIVEPQQRRSAPKPENLTDLQLLGRIRKLGFTVPIHVSNIDHPERHARDADVILQRYVEVYGTQPSQDQMMRVCGLE